jgi:hypothetical protein
VKIRKPLQLNGKICRCQQNVCNKSGKQFFLSTNEYNLAVQLTGHTLRTRINTKNKKDMRKTVRLIEMEGNFLILSNDPIHVKESGIEVLPDGSLSKNIIINESSQPMENGMKIIFSSQKLGWISSDTAENNIKKIVRAELRTSEIKRIMENNGQCEIECMVETKTFGNSDLDFYEADVEIPYLINNLPIINLA